MTNEQFTNQILKDQKEEFLLLAKYLLKKLSLTKKGALRNNKTYKTFKLLLFLNGFNKIDFYIDSMKTGLCKMYYISKAKIESQKREIVIL